MTIVRTLSLVLLITTATSGVAFAQARTTLSLGAGVTNFDLSGTGTTPVFTARVSRGLPAKFVIEGGLVFAKPEQQFGASTLIAPEAQLQFHLPVGRFTPYLGAGIGLVRESSDVIETDWTPTVSFAGGARVGINDRVGLFGELRIRGYEWNFVGTMADVVFGAAIRLGR
jgi:opacity protein-like surface antigen